MRIHRIADLERLHLRNKRALEFIGDFLGHDEAFCGNARLAIIDNSRFDRGLYSLIEIGARHDDERIAAAEFEHDLLDLLRRGNTDLNSRAFTARQCRCGNSPIGQDSVHLLCAY